MEARSEKATPSRETLSPLEWMGEDLERAERRFALEWLEADGLGGFACGTAAGPSLRRYHGWYSPQSRSRDLRSPLVAEMRRARLGRRGGGGNLSISEVFDGDEPHTPRGSFAEERNVGEIARIFQTYLQRGH